MKPLKSLKTFKIDIDKIKENPGYPSKERMNKGPVAVIECPEEIPCNPCETICKKGAIYIGLPITNLPKLDFDKCSGCGKCIAICPGLAIFVIDDTYSESEAAITIPYEKLYIPEKGEVVCAVDRNGNIVCNGVILKVQSPKSFDKTAVITFKVPKEFSEIVRNFKIKEKL